MCPITSSYDPLASNFLGNDINWINAEVDDSSASTEVVVQACVLNASSGSSCGSSVGSGVAFSGGHKTLLPSTAAWAAGGTTDFYYFEVGVGSGTFNRVRGFYMSYF